MADEEQQMTVEALHSLEENETTIRNGFRTFTDVGRALLEIRDARQYTQKGFDSFEDYCHETFEIERSQAYRLMDSAKVVSKLEISGAEVLPDNEAQARPLAELPEEKQADAWQEAVKAAPKGKVTASIVQKVVDRIKNAMPNKKAKAASKGWTKEMLKDDEELAKAFTKIEKVYGKPSTDAIRHGAIEGMGRADVMQLANLPTAKMEEIENLIMANHWTPKKALAFLAHQPDEETTLEEMENYALATKGGYTTVEIGAFLHTCKQLRK